MSGFTQLTEVDFDQIKLNLINYLKSTGKFTDYNFDGSNLQVILNLLSYVSQLNAYSTNVIANESFLSSATIRDNVVLNARTLGYVPSSAKSARSSINVKFNLKRQYFPLGQFPQFLVMEPGPTFSSATNGFDNYTFNVIERQVAPVMNDGSCTFRDLVVYEGTFLTSKFVRDTSQYNQKFILENRNIDSSTIRVMVKESSVSDILSYYKEAQSLVELTEDSRVYWLEEVDNGFYELTFGDGLFGKRLENGAEVRVDYLEVSGSSANGVNTSKLSFLGQLRDNNGFKIFEFPQILSSTPAEGGADIEDVSSIKMRAPKFYGAQKRCVTSSDYESLIRQIYPAVSDVYVFGGELLDIPEYGRVYVCIKPLSSNSLSNITKNYIKQSLDDYRIASLDIRFIDPIVIYVECVSSVKYNNRVTTKSASEISSSVRNTLNDYSKSSTIAKFGGVVRYSRVVGVIDDSDVAITRNNSYLRMRMDLKVVLNGNASYEICFVQPIQVSCDQPSVWSSGFYLEINGVVDNRLYFFEDDLNGNIVLFYFNSFNEKVIVDKKFGTVDYTKGEILLGYQKSIKIVNTEKENGIIQIRTLPENQDIVATQQVYLELDVSESQISSTVDKEIVES